MKKALLAMLVICFMGCSDEPSPCDGPYKISGMHPHVGIMWPNGKKQEICCKRWEFGEMGTGGIVGSHQADYSVRIIYSQGGGVVVMREGEFWWWWSKPHK